MTSPAQNSHRTPLPPYLIETRQRTESKQAQEAPAPVGLVPVSVKSADGFMIGKSVVALVVCQGFTSAISFGLHKPLREEQLPATYAAQQDYSGGYIDWSSAILLGFGSYVGDALGKYVMEKLNIEDMVVDQKNSPGWAVTLKTVGKVAFIGCFSARNVLFKDLVTPQGSFTIGALAKGLTLACGIVAAKCSAGRDMIFKAVDRSEKKQDETLACKAIGAVFYVAAGGLAKSAAPAMSLGPLNSDSESVGATVSRTAIALGAWFEVQDFVRDKFSGKKEGLIAWTGGKLFNAVSWAFGGGAKKEADVSVPANTVPASTNTLASPVSVKVAPVPVTLEDADSKSRNGSLPSASSANQQSLNLEDLRRNSTSVSTSDDGQSQISQHTTRSDSELRRRTISKLSTEERSSELPVFKASEFNSSPANSPAKHLDVRVHQASTKGNARPNKT